MVAGLLTGVLISLAGLASVFAVCAGLALAAPLLVAGLRVPTLAAAPEEGRPSVLAGLAEGLRPGGRAAAAAADAGPADGGGDRGGRAGPAVRHPGDWRAAPLGGLGRVFERRLGVGAVLAAPRARLWWAVGWGCRSWRRRFCSASCWRPCRSGLAWPGRSPSSPSLGRASTMLNVALPLDAAAFGSAAADGPGLRRPRGAHVCRATPWGVARPLARAPRW